MDNMENVALIIRKIREELEIYYDIVSTNLKELLLDLFEECNFLSDDVKKAVANILLKEIQDDRVNLKCYLYSFLIRLDFNEGILNSYISFVLNTNKLTVYSKYYIYMQLKAFLEEVVHLNNKAMWRFFCQIMTEFKATFQLKNYTTNQNRKKSKVIIITDKFVPEMDDFMVKALDFSKFIMEDMKKDVLLINTAEDLSFIGRTDFFLEKNTVVKEETLDERIVEWGDIKIPYLQCSNLPKKSEIIKMLDFIYKLNPMCIIDMSQSSVLADLSRQICPVIEIDSLTEIEQKLTLLEKGEKSDIVLSIAIPSYNRGHRALASIEKLMSASKDLEVEFIVSNNGSTENKEGYNKIKEYAIQDSRILYNEFTENQYFIGNFWKVILMARGKYVMLCSDEDEVIIENLEEYIMLLKSNPMLGVVRSSEAGGYYCSEVNEYKISGDEACSSFFLRNNYMSGIIYRTDCITEEFIRMISEKNKDNKAFYYYPHEFLDMYICAEYDFCAYKRPLFKKGTAEPEDSELLEYNVCTSRLLQHSGFTELLNQIEFQNIDITMGQYIKLCNKTFFLLSLSKEYFVNWEEVCGLCRKQCIESIKQLELGVTTQQYKEQMVEIIESLYNHFVKL